MSDVLNANPTIRNASELPTRRKEEAPVLDDPLGIFADIKPTSVGFDDPPPLSPGGALSDSEEEAEPIDEQEVYDLISTISDPEHPLSLGSLSVVNLQDIHITSLGCQLQIVRVEITPTITHCSLATLIGLGVRVRLEQALPPRFRIDVRIKEGTHSTAEQVTKQLGDKERVAAALENAQLMSVLRRMLATCR